MTDLAAHLQSHIDERYRIQREIGRGGMAVVFLADDRKHDRKVALKVLDPDRVGRVAADRFHREIQVVARLQHPHILPLFDSGEADGLFFYVMPYVDGESLRDRLDREGPLDVGDSLRITRELAAGLSHAHHQGLIHRDIKPENILLSDGHAVLADFGIARALERPDGDGKLTRTGLIVGTPTYMSPEQWRGAEPDARSDLYGLGCLLFEMLVGEPPFTGPTPATLLAAHGSDPVPSVRERRDGVPLHVDEALERALAKQPDDRYPSVDRFAEHLEGGGPGPGTEEGGTRWFAWSRVSGTLPNLTTVAATVLLAAGIAAGAGMLLSDGDSPLPPDRVAVGLFENRTGDPQLDDLGPMAADWITGGLQRAGFVRVVPSPTALQASNFLQSRNRGSGQRDPVQALARETGAGLVVTGSYYSRDGQVEFQVQVADARNRDLVGALNPVRGPPDSPGIILEALRKRVMGLLAVARDERLANASVATAEPPNFEAYREFNRGLEEYTRNNYRDALPHLYEAHARDSVFVLPLLYAAINHLNLQEHSAADSVLRLVAATRSRLTEYHRHWMEYLQARLRGDNSEARRAIREAADLAPGSKAAYNAAWMSVVTHRPAEALESLETLHPERGAMRGWFQYWSVLTEALHRLGRHEEELESARRARDLYPERTEALELVGEARAALGRVDRLPDLAGRTSGRPTRATLLTRFAVELRAHGREESADRLLRTAVEWFERRLATGESSRGLQTAYADALQVSHGWEQTYDLISRLQVEDPEDIGLRIWRGILAAGTGREAEARRVADWIGTLERPYSFGLYSFHQARIAALLGDAPEAVALLREAFARGHPYPRHLGVNFHGIRDHTALEELMEPKG